MSNIVRFKRGTIENYASLWTYVGSDDAPEWEYGASDWTFTDDESANNTVFFIGQSITGQGTETGIIFVGSHKIGGTTYTFSSNGDITITETPGLGTVDLSLTDNASANTQTASLNVKIAGIKEMTSPLPDDMLISTNAVYEAMSWEESPE